MIIVAIFLSSILLCLQSVMDTLVILSYNRLCGLVVRLQIQRSRVRSPALPDFLSSSGSGTGSTQPREPREVN